MGRGQVTVSARSRYYELSAQMQTTHLVAWQVWGYSLHTGENMY